MREQPRKGRVPRWGGSSGPSRVREPIPRRDRPELGDEVEEVIEDTPEPQAPVMSLRLPEPPPRDRVISQLLYSIALEETALAALINAEAEKVQAVGRNLARPCTFDDVLTFQRSVAEVMQTVVRKEEILLKKLQTVMELAPREEEMEEEGGGDEGASLPEV